MKIRDCVRIRTIEQILDEFNNAKGSQDKFCQFCNSNQYNTLEGIVHTELCIIRQIRTMYKEDCHD
jgi:hypothetical protein